MSDFVTPVRYNLDGDLTLDRNELLTLLEDLMQVITIMVAFFISCHLVFLFLAASLHSLMWYCIYH